MACSISSFLFRARCSRLVFQVARRIDAISGGGRARLQPSSHRTNSFKMAADGRMAAGRKKLPIHLILVLRPSIHASHHERLSVSMRACIHPIQSHPIPSHPNCHSATDDDDDETTPHPIMLVEQWSEMRTATDRFADPADDRVTGLGEIGNRPIWYTTVMYWPNRWPSLAKVSTCQSK